MTPYNSFPVSNLNLNCCVQMIKVLTRVNRLRASTSAEEMERVTLVNVKLDLRLTEMPARAQVNVILYSRLQLTDVLI